MEGFFLEVFHLMEAIVSTEQHLFHNAEKLLDVKGGIGCKPNSTKFGDVQVHLAFFLQIQIRGELLTTSFLPFDFAAQTKLLLLA